MADQKKSGTVKVTNGLTYREEAALRMHMQAQEPALSTSMQAQLFELYLNGNSCEQIAKLNKSIRLGAIVRACQEGDWYQKKTSYMNQLLEDVRSRVEQVQCESLYFASSLLAAAHKMYGTKIQRYLQTGDEKELGELGIYTLRQYKEVVDLLLKMTGQDNNKKVSGKVDVTHNVGATLAAGHHITPEQAAKILLNMDALSGEVVDSDEPSE